MEPLAQIVCLKKDGLDGLTYDMAERSCVIGRHLECDIRIQKAEVSRQQVRIGIDENGSATITQLSKNSETLLNGVRVTDVMPLHTNDVFTVGGRHFRFIAGRFSSDFLLF